MALFETITWSNTDTLITAIKDFAEGNGWTVDYFGTYSSHQRAHIHKGEAHFEIWYLSGSGFNAAGCTGYDSGQGPTTQPGISPLISNNYFSSGEICLVSSGQSIYISRGYNGSGRYWGCLGYIPNEEKIGAWTGGTVLSMPSATTPMFYTVGTRQTVYANGGWSSVINDGVANVVYGLMSNNEMYSHITFFGLSGVLVRVPLFKRNASNYNLFHPLGYAPGIRLTSASTIYDTNEIVTIGGDQYVYQYLTGASYFLIKLEA